MLNVYIFMSLLRWLVLDRRLKVFNRIPYLVLFLTVYASTIYIFSGTISTWFYLVLQSIALFYALVSVQSDRNIIEQIKITTIVTTLSASLYGILFSNIKGVYEISGGFIILSARYSGTLGDPNYMAFYYCVAFSYLLYLNFTSKVMKIVLSLLLCISIALTGSITGLLVFILIFTVYLFHKNRLSLIKRILTFTVLVSFVYLFYNLLNSNTDIGFFDLYRNRIFEKVEYLLSGNLSGFTTGRTEYSLYYILYLFQQNLFRVFLGGYQLNALGLSGSAFEIIKFAAHNSYIDVLMTSGLCGLMIFIFAIFGNMKLHYKEWKMTGNIEEFSSFATTLVISVFISGLSIFPSSNYLFFLFL